MKSLLHFLDTFSVWSVLIRLSVAAIMGGIIGSERGRHGRAAGLRTHILVCVGAAITSLTSLFLIKNMGYNGDVARLSAQVISGIGFLGAGTILIRNNTVITGLTTAAGMWATAAIGVAIGYGFYSGALVATIICIFSVTVLNRIERKRKNNIYVYIELTDIADTERVIDILRQSKDTLISYDIIPAKSGHAENVGIVCLLNGDRKFDELKRYIYKIYSVALIIYDVNS